MSCKHCEHCRALADPQHVYMQRVRRVALLIRLRDILANPQPTKVSIRRKDAKRKTDHASIDRAA